MGATMGHAIFIWRFLLKYPNNFCAFDVMLFMCAFQVMLDELVIPAEQPDTQQVDSIAA
jgi:hypothetical protein